MMASRPSLQASMDWGPLFEDARMRGRRGDSNAEEEGKERAKERKRKMAMQQILRRSRSKLLKYHGDADAIFYTKIHFPVRARNGRNALYSGSK